MRKRELLLAAALLWACDPRRPEDVDTQVECGTHPTQQREMKDCLVQCSEAANPKSDEEGEDLVLQCEKSCRNIYCWPQWVYWKDGSWRDCRKGLGDLYRTACLNAGWKPDR